MKKIIASIFFITFSLASSEGKELKNFVESSSSSSSSHHALPGSALHALETRNQIQKLNKFMNLNSAIFSLHEALIKDADLNILLKINAISADVDPSYERSLEKAKQLQELVFVRKQQGAVSKELRTASDNLEKLLK